MARIETYIQDDNITDNDIIIGSDGDNVNKTKNYTVGGLRNNFLGDLQASNQNNIIKSIYFKAVTSIPLGQTALSIAVSSINTYPAFTINADEIYFFHFIISDSYYVYAFKDIGKGDYGDGGTQITKFNLQLISKRPISEQTILEESTTETFNLGNITPLNISQAVNALNPTIDIQPLAEGFTIFKAIISGEDKLYLYQGDSGVTGSGANQTTLADFNDITGFTGFQDLSVLELAPPSSGTFTVDCSKILGVDYTQAVTAIETIEVGSEVVGGNAILKFNTTSEPTVTGATKIDSSSNTFVTATDMYMVFKVQSDGVVYKILLA